MMWRGAEGRSRFSVVTHDDTCTYTILWTSPPHMVSRSAFFYFILGGCREKKMEKGIANSALLILRTCSLNPRSSCFSSYSPHSLIKTDSQKYS